MDKNAKILHINATPEFLNDPEKMEMIQKLANAAYKRTDKYLKQYDAWYKELESEDYGRQIISQCSQEQLYDLFERSTNVMAPHKDQ